MVDPSPSSPPPSTSPAADAIAADLQVARDALRSISHWHCATEEVGCECPSCTASAALDSFGAWRFRPALAYRVTDGHHPREAAMYEAWRRYFDGNPDAQLRQILHDEVSVSVRDWHVASSVVRWLATNVGSTILRAAGWADTNEVARWRSLAMACADQLSQIDVALDALAAHEDCSRDALLEFVAAVRAARTSKPTSVVPDAQACSPAVLSPSARAIISHAAAHLDATDQIDAVRSAAELRSLLAPPGSAGS